MRRRVAGRGRRARVQWAKGKGHSRLAAPRTTNAARAGASRARTVCTAWKSANGTTTRAASVSASSAYGPSAATVVSYAAVADEMSASRPALRPCPITGESCVAAVSPADLSTGAADSTALRSTGFASARPRCVTMRPSPGTLVNREASACRLHACTRQARIARRSRGSRSEWGTARWAQGVGVPSHLVHPAWATPPC